MYMYVHVVIVRVLKSPRTTTARTVAGSGATFTVYDEVQHTNRDGSDYCPRICYFYSFWFYIIGYVFLLLAVIYCAVLGLIMCLSISSHSDSRRG